MGTTAHDAWAQRWEQTAADLLEERVVAAAPFVRPRGWRPFARAVAAAGAHVIARTLGRDGPVRLPEASLVAVTGDAVHLLQARPVAGAGPVPRAVRRLLAWERRGLRVEVAPDALGTRVRLVPAVGPPVELIGPPGELTRRVVRALRARPGAPAARAARRRLALVPAPGEGG